MRKEEKQEIVQALSERIKSYGSFYITDTADLTVEKVNGIRRKCFEQGIVVQVVKNTLIKKALIEAGIETEELDAALKGDKPVLKAAYIEETAFIGDNQLDTLVNLKSKNELIADVIALLQSPAKNVISALQSGGNTISGLVKALEERG
jgi:large subunit ribosomal protein L10